MWTHQIYIKNSDTCKNLCSCVHNSIVAINSILSTNFIFLTQDISWSKSIDKCFFYSNQYIIESIRNSIILCHVLAEPTKINIVKEHDYNINRLKYVFRNKYNLLIIYNEFNIRLKSERSVILLSYKQLKKIKTTFTCLNYTMYINLS